jgi:hypothetical protein
VDSHFLVLRVCEDLKANSTPEEVHLLTTYNLELEPGELEAIVYNILKVHNYHDVYNIKHTVSRAEMGASGIWEEVILEVSKVVASGVAGAVAKSCVDRFIRKKSVDEESPTPVDMRHQLYGLKQMVSTNYHVPKRLLKLVRSELKGSSLFAVFEDDLGNQYEAEQAGPNYCHLRLLKRGDYRDAEYPD